VPDLSQSVPVSFIIETVLVIFAGVALGIAAVRRAKQRKEQA